MDKKSLKAFIRYDGTGRIIPSSLILAVKKPKDGNWKEIRAYECCDPIYDKTTTTTTTSTTTTAPSDIRLKNSIMLTGAKVGNLSEYTWKWNSIAKKLKLDGYPTKGVLAQEALLSYPEAVSVAEDGYLRVDYSKIV